MPLADFVGVDDLADYRAADPATVVRQAQATIRSYCGWHVAPELTETLTVDGNGGRHLWLPTLRVSDVASVTDEGTLLTADEYDWSATGYLMRRSGYWSTRPRQIEVELTHGFDEPPADIVAIAAALAGRAASSLVRRESAGGVSLEYIADLLELEKATLDRYKLPARI